MLQIKYIQSGNDKVRLNDNDPIFELMPIPVCRSILKMPAPWVALLAKADMSGKICRANSGGKKLML